MSNTSEEFFGNFASDIVLHFPDPVLICDEQYQLVAVNRALLDFFGKRERDLLGQTLEVLFGADIWGRNGAEQRIKGAFSSRKKIESMRMEGELPDIGRRILIVRLFKVRTQPHKEFLISFTDKTEEIAERQLIQRSKDHLLRIFDGIHDPVAVIDKDLTVIRINRSMLEMLGAGTYRDCLGQKCLELFHKPKAACDVHCPVMKTFSEAEARQDFWMMDKAKGRLFDAITYPLLNSVGSVYAVILFCRDISRTLQVEAELYESERARVLGSLVAGIAHEIRNPLAIISSTAQYCKGEISPEAPIHEDMDTIMNSSAQANSVIGALMDYAKPKDVQFEIISLEDILDQGLSLVKNRCKKGGVKIKKNVERHLPKLKLDRQRFLQACVNILLNSIDAMPDGGTLYVEARKSKQARWIELTIRDTGRGVPKELIGRVLQPFFSTKKDGVGLGLPLAEEIIRAHGGKLVFSGEESTGAVARIELPIIMEK